VRTVIHLLSHRFSDHRYEDYASISYSHRGGFHNYNRSSWRLIRSGEMVITADDSVLTSGMRSIIVLYTIGAAESPIHGYGLIQQIDSVSQGNLKMPSGTIYPILHHLVEQGLIEFNQERSRRGPARKCYYLTTKGENALIHTTFSLTQFLISFGVKDRHITSDESEDVD
jgi:DNA-binding PadR family transcriptional regulator